MVEGFSTGAHNVAARNAHGPVFAVGKFECGAMDGGGHVEPAPRQIDSAAGHEVERADVLGEEIFGEFVGRDDGGAVEFRQRDGVEDVILVGVGAENPVARHLRERHAAVRIVLQVGIKDDAGAPSLMGNTATPFDDAMVYYKSRDYKTAEGKFSKLLFDKPQNDTLKYYDALCQVRLKNEDSALQLLSAISQPAGSELGIKAKWYSALILVHQNKPADAKKPLTELKSSGSDYAAKAGEILAQLK